MLKYYTPYGLLYGISTPKLQWNFLYESYRYHFFHITFMFTYRYLLDHYHNLLRGQILSLLPPIQPLFLLFPKERASKHETIFPQLGRGGGGKRRKKCEDNRTKREEEALFFGWTCVGCAKLWPGRLIEKVCAIYLRIF